MWTRFFVKHAVTALVTAVMALILVGLERFAAIPIHTALPWVILYWVFATHVKVKEPE